MKIAMLLGMCSLVLVSCGEENSTAGPSPDQVVVEFADLVSDGDPALCDHLSPTALEDAGGCDRAVQRSGQGSVQKCFGRLDVTGTEENGATSTVSFDCGAEGGAADLVREDGQWVIVESNFGSDDARFRRVRDPDRDEPPIPPGAELCADLEVGGEFIAMRLTAKGVSCEQAAVVAEAAVTASPPSGWICDHRVGSLVTCDKGTALIFFNT